MSLLTDFKAYLEAQGLVPTGWTVKLGIMPPKPDQVIALFAAGGGPTPTARLGIDAPALQVRVRGGENDHEGPLAIATAIAGALHEASGLIGATVYPWVIAQHAPQAMGIDPNDTKQRPEYVVMFKLAREAA